MLELFFLKSRSYFNVSEHSANYLFFFRVIVERFALFTISTDKCF